MSRKALAAFGLLFGGALVIAACNGIGNVGNPDVSGDNYGPTGNSDGRKFAARTIDSTAGKMIHVYLSQQNLVDPLQDPCLPFGGPGKNPWTIIAQRTYTTMKATPTPDGTASEYDFIQTLTPDSEICLGMRTPNEPNFPLQFTQVEFNLRDVSPWVYGHVPGNDYNYFVGPPPYTQADYPSNDPIVPARSLFDRAGGDVLVWIEGIDFSGAPAITNAYMNTLGPTGWVLFMRDNAFRSGRFYNITGALKGAPRAFADTPNPADDGFFESVQVNGDNFDAFSESFANINPATLSFCGAPNPAKPYAFLDRSNFSEVSTPFAPVPGPGQGGFMLLIHRSAFAGAQVVVNPNVPGNLPAPVLAGDLFGPPPSGYDSTVLPAVNAAHRFPKVDGPAGIHELGFSVFFIHGS
ncbi:MAG TPA: hypothetical protein VMV81_10025 [Phycisphaerae bacterium]|nr:hypothetical protein [Phycisphaerae bacterium]